MAPEVASKPGSAQLLMSDRFSLAIADVFHLHAQAPLEEVSGRRRCPTVRQLIPTSRGASARTTRFFVYDPGRINRPIPGEHDPLLSFWPVSRVAAAFLHPRAFFTERPVWIGCPVMEKRVAQGNVRYARRDLLLQALHRGELLRPRTGPPEAGHESCWSCGRALETPPRMRLGVNHDASLVVLSRGTRLFPHHLERETYDFSRPLAEVTISPFGLRNLSSNNWVCRGQNNSISVVPPRRGACAAAPIATSALGRSGARCASGRPCFALE